MTDVSLKALSIQMKAPIKDLVQELSKIGILKNENDLISIKEKNFLLKYLKNKKRFASNTFVLQRKTRSTLNISSISGKNKSVQVEIRKKRTYIKNEIIIDVKEKNNLNKLKKVNVSEKKFISNSADFNKDKNHDKNAKKKLHQSIKIHYLAQNISSNTSKKNIQLNNNINTKKIAKNNIDTWRFDESEKKDYHLTTFLHARQAEDDNDREIETDRKNNHRISKNYRHKKNKKTNYISKSNKDHLRFNIKNKKNHINKNKSVLLQQVFKKPQSIINKDIIINNAITVSDLANKMSVKSAEVIKNIMKIGIIATTNQILDQETAQLIAEEMGHKVIIRRENELEELIMKDRDTGNNISIIRAPVVTIMGHVDHGKTSLLDYIRSTQTALHESGGITQNIGAYHVNTNLGSITFVDTPGHSAFTAMRSRGAQITDIVVLVVASDDGVMPQTIEAIQHAKEANVPIIVAINKIDKINSDIKKIKNDLMKYDILSEEWGGENIFVGVSAKTGEGINNLLNSILLQAEILELKAIPNGMAEGVVIESFIDKGRGPIATILVKKGNLKKGDIILCGFEYGRVKALRDERGNNVDSVGPSIPVEVLGLSKIPISGDIVTVVRSEKNAKEVACYRKNKFREIKLKNQNKSSLENMFNDINKNNFSELKIILKSDIHGSLEAISGALLNLSTEKVKLKIIGSGVGGITETDASLALAANAIILGFNVRADSSAKKIIHLERLNIRYYSVIYDLLNDVKSVMTGLLSIEYKQNIIGLAQVRNVFKSPKFGLIAGCMVTEGVIKRNNPIRVLRENIVIYEGELESLRRFKEDVAEIRNGIECGIGIKNYNDIRIGDFIEVFEVREIEKTL